MIDKNKNHNNSERKKNNFSVSCYYPIAGEYIDWKELSEEQRNAACQRMLQNGLKALKSGLREYEDRK